MTVYQSILDTIGATPVVRLNRLAPDVPLYAKVEAFNPMGSVKDRMALFTIEAAERSGELQPGQTVIEATSGNTGIGLAMVCARKGYPLVLVMSESFSIERRKILRFLGARVVLTPAELKGSGMLQKAEELAAAHDWFLVRQVSNPANATAHEQTTAEEILDDFAAEPLDWFVTGYGTGGTFRGVSTVLRARSPATRIALCEPDNSPLVGSGVAQPRDDAGRVTESHPAFRPHLMQGWTPDFIPDLAQQALDSGAADRVIAIDGEAAMRCARDLARQEGIFTGTSGGATLAGALELAREVGDGARILCMLPDTGERYLSTPLFDAIGIDMNEAEIAISRSTPFARFDAPPPPPAPDDAGQDADSDTDAPGPGPVDTDADVERQVDAWLNDEEQPVVMFALAWCEFCWSVRKLFGALDIPYRSVDLDSVAMQKDDLGGRVRAVLKRRIGTPTIPQVFVAGNHIGGATDTFDAVDSGELESLLKSAGIEMQQPAEGFEPRQFLPGWLQTRSAAASED